MYRRFLIVLIMLLLAIVVGHQIGTLRDYPKGEGDFLNAPNGAHFATVILMKTRRPFSQERIHWRIEVGHGVGENDMADKGALIFSKDLPTGAFVLPFSIEQAMTWALDSSTITFNTRPTPLKVPVTAVP